MLSIAQTRLTNLHWVFYCNRCWWAGLLGLSATKIRNTWLWDAIVIALVCAII